MITPPASLVERAWKRGLEVGRYKAVDDTLAHGVEAYSGMPELFFTWVERADKRVHFEFLDNSVRAGRAPAHRRVRLERQAQRARRPAPARRRALSPRQRRRHGARVPVRRRGAAAAGAERRLSRCLHRPLSRGRLRRPGIRADLSAHRCGRACVAGSRSAGDRRSRTPTCAPVFAPPCLPRSIASCPRWIGPRSSTRRRAPAGSTRWVRGDPPPDGEPAETRPSDGVAGLSERPSPHVGVRESPASSIERIIA